MCRDSLTITSMLSSFSSRARTPLARDARWAVLGFSRPSRSAIRGWRTGTSLRTGTSSTMVTERFASIPTTGGPYRSRFPNRRGTRDSRGYDIAAAYFPQGAFANANGLLTKTFITERRLGKWELGVGDDLMVISRHVGYQGKVQNRPVLHSGMISLSPPEDVYNPETQQDEPSFLIEARSWGGFSGSPVLGYRAPLQATARCC